MESDADIENYEVIPMKPCRSRSLPFNQFRQIPEVEKPRKSSAHPTFASPNSHNSFKVRFLQNMSSTKLQVFKSVTVFFLQKNSALDIY